MKKLMQQKVFKKK